MADMHVLEGDSSKFRVVMHFAVPPGNNSVGVAWATALVEQSGFNEDGTTATPKTILHTIDASEKTEIEAGTVFEFVVDVPGVGEGSGASRTALLRERYAAYKTELTAKLQNQLGLFGHTESEV